MDVSWLTSDEGRAAVLALMDVDPLQARSLLPHLRPDQISAALTQAAHRPDGFPLPLLTADGVQQATPAAVARGRARRLADAGVTTVIDAGCGIGVDSWAFAGAGLHVIAFEADEHTAQVARANLAGLDVEVVHADVTAAELPDAALFVDPARRRPHKDATGRPLRIRDPEQWSPPWSWVLAQTGDRPVVARIRPGHRDLPAGTEWHCTSSNRRLVDATVWFPPLAVVDRRATVLPDHELVGPPAPAHVGEVGRFIIDPDPAIVRTGLVSNAAAAVNGQLLDEHLAFITTDAPPPFWLGRAMEVLEQVPLKRVRQAARRHRLRSATVWSRGFERPPVTGLPEGQDAIVVAARLGTHRTTRAWIGRPVRVTGR